MIGNLGSGKSLVRRMLERLGGLGVDSDLLSHRILWKTNPIHAQVLNTFGQTILNETGGIDRKKLASIVFSEPDQLQKLEKLIHPAVETVVKKIILNSRAPFVVIEAIKLLESGLAQDCDSIWAVNVPVEVQIERVMRARGMSRRQALERIQNQTHPEVKADAAQVIIDNSGNLDFTWKQLNDAVTALRTTNERFSGLMAGFEQWKTQHRFIRLLQPSNTILTKKLISAAQPVEWVNRWISSALHQYTEQLEMVTRSNYLDMLVNFQGLLVQPEKNPEMLSLVKIEDFILQPYYLFKLNPLKEVNLQSWLNAMILLAEHSSCEAIVIPVHKKYGSISTSLLTEGFENLSIEDELFNYWKAEVVHTQLTGYNVMAKSLPDQLLFS